MYKDKGKQREASKEAMRRHRARKQGITLVNGSVITGITTEDVSDTNVILKRGKDIKCFEDLPTDVQQTINKVSESNEEKQKRTAVAIKYQHTFGAGAYYPHGAVCTGVITGKPGDEDYNGICTPEWRAERGR